jgi:hypothetical protein
MSFQNIGLLEKEVAGFGIDYLVRFMTNNLVVHSDGCNYPLSFRGLSVACLHKQGDSAVLCANFVPNADSTMIPVQQKTKYVIWSVGLWL